MFQHIHNKEQSEEYTVAWDSAMHEQHAGSVPPPGQDVPLDTDETDAYPEVVMS